MVVFLVIFVMEDIFLHFYIFLEKKGDSEMYNEIFGFFY